VVTLADQRPTGESRGITVNSFLLALNVPDKEIAGGRNVGVVIGELNAWHSANQGTFFGRHWVGRGTPPSGWMTPVVDATDPNQTAWLNTSWSFDPRAPFGTPLVPGQYVRLTGPLWQDVPHDEGGPNATSSPWSFFNGRLGAWLEIHPVDWIESVVAPPVKKTPFVVQAITTSPAPTARVTHTMAPDEPAPDAGWTLRCRELIDGRFTDTSSVTLREVNLRANALEVTVEVERRVEIGPPPPPGQPRLDRIIPGRFKAVYVVWWERGPAATGCSVD
jgi:hypothetical protein